MGHPVMTAVDLTEDPVIVMIGVLVTGMTAVHLCVGMTVVTEMTEVVVEVGEVHPVMTADHLCVGMTADLGMTEDPGMTADLGIAMIEDHPVMTVEMEDSVEVTAIAVMIEDLVKTVVTTGVQDREDFHPHHVMTVVEVMTAEMTETAVKDSLLQGMKDLPTVHRNQNNSLHKIVGVMAGLLLNVNM